MRTWMRGCGAGLLLVLGLVRPLGTAALEQPATLTDKEAQQLGSYAFVSFFLFSELGTQKTSDALLRAEVWGENKRTGLLSLSDSLMMELIQLKERLVQLAAEPFMGFSKAAMTPTAQQVVDASRGATQTAVHAIEAYEQAYARPGDRLARLRARALNCEFHTQLYDLVFEQPRRLAAFGLLPKSLPGPGGTSVPIDAIHKDEYEVVRVSRELVCQPVKISPPGQAGPTRRTGTAFVIHPDGRLMTAAHLVKDARKVDLVCPGTGRDWAIVEPPDPKADVAVLVPARGRKRFDYVEEFVERYQEALGPPSKPYTTAYLSFADPRTLDVGASVFTVGYPAPELLGTEAKFTQGSITALSGPGGDDRYLQISVPVQPGNSGGPLLNRAGDVVGIVTSTASVKAFLGATGSLPQNVNWAIKGIYGVRLFDAPPSIPRAATRQDAIKRAMAATCLVSVEAKE